MLFRAFPLLFLPLAAFAAMPPGPSGDARMTAKLDAQWKRYEAARAAIAARQALPPGERKIGREEWERILALPEAFTAEELSELRRSQDERALAAKERARHESPISLEAIRALPQAEGRREAEAFCSKLPKGGMLHIHPTGTLTRETARALLERRDGNLPLEELRNGLAPGNENSPHLYDGEISALETLGADRPYSGLDPAGQASFLSFFVLPPGAHPFGRFDAVFWFVSAALGDSWDARVQAVEAFAERAVAQGVSYVEFTWGLPTSSFDSVDALGTRLQEKYGLESRFNVAFYRGLGDAEALARIERMIGSNAPSRIAGIDLLGNETLLPALEQGQLIYGAALGSRFHRTMHAGELGDPRNARDAILLGAERLGHGVKLAEDPVALEYAARHGIGIETNLTSNLKLRAIGSIAEHPFLRYLRLGAKVSLSTDDEGILETSIDQECELAVLGTDVEYSELKAMAFNSIGTAFLPESDRARLSDALAERFERFESGLSAR